jgi:anti-sigma regulatory factor (Ser/Thr protein kinase)
MKEQKAQFDLSLDSLEAIGMFIADFMKSVDISDDTSYDFQVSADEHFSNLYEHAFNKQSGHHVTIICHDDEAKTQVRVMDDSDGFDPRRFSVPDVENAAIYELPPGGFGNYFICELMDDVEYIYRPSVKNELILTKYKK